MPGPRDDGAAVRRQMEEGKAMTGVPDGRGAGVIGGGTGLGLACAQALAAAGARGFLTRRRAAVLESALAGLPRTAAAAGCAASDATDAAATEAVLAAAAAAMGRLDTVVIAAGATARTPADATDPAEFRRIPDDNVLPVFHAVR